MSGQSTAAVTGSTIVADLDRQRWRAVSALLDELLDADVETRQARLEAVRRDDAALADEVETLLAHDTQARTQGFLDGSALAAGEGLEGWTLGGYTLESSIGRGGMGSVWLAHRSDGRYEGKAAVKLLNLALMGRDGARRFRREGSILARLSHPHIARLLDAGLAPGGQPYLVLEHVEGEPIDRWCDARRLDVDARLRLFVDVVDAVAHAHGQLVVHLDLKPSNILVTAAGEVKLLDFGIARLTDADDGDETARTTVLGARPFTPDYAAPEQLQGEPVSSATDVYALGTLLYVLLSGRHPTARGGATLAQRLHDAVHAEPVRLSLAVREGTADARNAEGTAESLAAARSTTPAALARALAGDLDNIVAKALRKNAGERYPTPAALAEDLRRRFARQPVLARADSLGYRVGRFLVRHRWGLGVGAAIVLSLAVGAGVAVWKSIEAEQRRAEAEREAERATASLDLLYVVLSDSGTMSAQTMRERLARIRSIVRDSSESPEVKLNLLARLAGRYMELNAFDDMLALLAEMRELARGLNAPDERATIACGFANAYTVLGRYDDAERELATAARELAHVPARDLSPRTECWQAEAELAMLRGQLPRALAAAGRSVDALERRGVTRDPIYMAALNQSALAHAALADYRESYRTTRKARDALCTVGLQGTQQDLIIAMQEIDVLGQGGKPLDALRLLTELRAEPHVAVEQQVPPFAIQQRLGFVLLKLDRAGEALAAFDACLDGTRSAGNRLFERSCSWGALDALVALGRLEDARQRLASLPWADEEIAKGSSTGAKLLAIRARIALVADAPAAARVDAARAEAILAALHRPDPRLREVLLLESGSAAALGDWPRASERARAALARARDEALEPSSSAEVGDALLTQARIEAAQGRGDAARALAREASPHLEANLGPFHPLTVEAGGIAASGR